MKRENINYLAVGVLVLLASVTLLVFLFMLTGRSGAVDNYHAYYDNVSGLKYGTPVFYEGYAVGQIEALTPERESGHVQFRVDFSIREGWQIPSDSVAQMVSAGLLGTLSIDIAEGGAITMLSPGEEIEGAGAISIFTALNSVATDLNNLSRHGVRPLIENLNKRINSFADALEEGIPAVIGEAKVLTSRLNESAALIQKIISAENHERIGAFLGNVDKAASNLRQLTGNLNETREKLDDLLANLGQIVTDNRDDLESTIQALRESMDIVAEHVGSVAHHMEGTSRNMHEFSREIRDNPGLLLGGKAPRDKGENGQ